jgi:hypothetical protein
MWILNLENEEISLHNHILYRKCICNMPDIQNNLLLRTSIKRNKTRINSVAFRQKRTIPPGDRRWQANLVANFMVRVVSRGQSDEFLRLLILIFYVQSNISSLSSWGWVEPVQDQPFICKSDSAENRTRDLWICSKELWPLGHRSGPILIK